MNLREAAQQALEYIEQHAIIGGIPIRDALRAALADATIKDNLTVEPVGYVSGFNNGYAIVEPIDRSLLMPVGMALYRSPFKRKPLMDEERAFLVTRHSSFNRDYVKGEVVVTWVCDGDALIRAIERAHGIGG